MSETNQTSRNSRELIFILLLILLGVGGVLLAPTDREMYSGSESAPLPYYGVPDAKIRKIMADRGWSEAEARYYIRSLAGR